MNYTRLGRSGLKVSRLCLGTMNFGWEAGEDESFAMMDAALDMGINFFDTADVYGWKLGEGVTENILGRWFEQGGGRREKVVLATKLYGEMSKWPNGRGLSALHIREACEGSLRRMQVDHIDLYQFHHIDRETPWEEIWQASETLVRQGKVLYFGSSNFAGWHLAQAQESARSRNFMGLISEQTRYSLMCRTPELEVLPAAQGYGIGIIPWSPLQSGLLAGGAARGAGKRRQDKGNLAELKRHGKAIAAYESLCRKWKEDPADVALAWTLANPAVTAPIIGPRTMDQLKGSLRAFKVRLGAERMAQLDKIFPGPGGTAPEAYAW